MSLVFAWLNEQLHIKRNQSKTVKNKINNNSKKTHFRPRSWIWFWTAWQIPQWIVFQVRVLWRNSSVQLGDNFAFVKRPDVILPAIVQDTLPHYEAIRGQGSSGRPGGSAEERSFCRHNRSSCKAFGKSVATKEHSGLSQGPGLVSDGSHGHGEGGSWDMKGKGICFGLQMSQNTGIDPWRLVRKGRKNFLQR